MNGTDMNFCHSGYSSTSHIKFNSWLIYNYWLDSYQKKENYKESPTFPNDQNTFWYTVENAVLPGRKIINRQMRILQEDYDIRDILIICPATIPASRDRDASRSGKPLGSMTARTSLVFPVRSLHYLYQMMMRKYFLFRWIKGTFDMKKLSFLVCGLFLIAMAFLVVPVMGAATQIAVNAGNGQSATVGTAVTTLPSVIVQDANNTPVSGVSVTFSVTPGGGSVTSASATTDANGIATVGSWTLGTTAGSNTLTATSGSLPDSPVTFTATGTAGAATQIAVNAGNSQSTTVGTAVTTLPSVIVKDTYNNPVSGVSVTFAVATDGSSGTGLSATTGSNGIATVGSWTLSTTAGSNTLMATSESLSGSTVTFTATGTAVSISSYGNISVSSTPSGANVYLDNEYKGLTTLTMNNIANGNHIVIVRLTGYQDWTQNVIVLGDSTSLTATLVANTTTVVNGSISFTSSPTNANVYINSVLKGYTPITVYNITPASYTVTVQKPGYLIYANRFDVTSGNTTTVSVTLTVEPTATSTLSATAPITTATTATPTIKSTAKTYTPWPTNTPTAQSPVPLEICLGAIGIGIVLLKRRG